MTTPNAGRTLVIIQGTLSISNSFACVLIDSGVTHSFVFAVFVKRLLMKLVKLDNTIVVKTLAKNIMLSNLIYKSYIVKVANRELAVDLLLLDF